MNLTEQLKRDGNLLNRPQKTGPKPKRPLKRTVRPRQVSKKRSAQNRFYRVVRAGYMEKHPTCQHPGCMAPATDIHHRKGRIGDLLVDTRWFMSVCRPHHLHIHAHPLEARQAGLIL